MGQIILPTGVAPATPAAGYCTFYFKSSDKKLYYLDETGTERGPLVAAVAGTDFGYANVPQNSQSAAYTTVLADAGKHIYHPAADVTARTWTIDSNANVAYTIGTVITFDNDYGAGALTISITADTLVLVGAAGSTGNRTIASGGQATALKVTATRWRISGTGLS